MLTEKENLLETLKKEGKPDRLVNQYRPFALVLNDPVQRFTRGNRVRGVTSKDRWGTEIAFPADAPGPMPHVTEENKVCPDVTNWKQYVKVPDLVANCSTGWEDAMDTIEKIDKSEKLVTCFMGTGIFEQCHYLMGFEDTLTNLLLEPDAMHELIDVIAEYRFQYAKLLIDHLHPDVILSHDDWGTKRSLFMQPETWREFFKEHYRKIYGYMKGNDVIVMHHSDSFCEPLVEDMIDIGIDIWQGVLPDNDILKLQKQIDGRMVLMGGIDSVVDRIDASEQEIREHVRHVCETYGPGGHFIPCITYGAPGTIYPKTDEIISDEIDRYNQDKRTGE